MEEKLLEVVENKIQKLTKDKEQYEKLTEEMSGKMEIRDGKLVKTHEMVEYEEDFEKISLELEATKKEKDDIGDLLSKRQELKISISRKENLLKDKEQCENAIKEMSNKKVIENGKLVETEELLEYKNDLEKIEKELKIIQEQSELLQQIDETIKGKMEKYNIKSEKNKTHIDEDEIESEKIDNENGIEYEAKIDYARLMSKNLAELKEEREKIDREIKIIKESLRTKQHDGSESETLNRKLKELIATLNYCNIKIISEVEMEKELLEDMVNSREKREEERYSEMIEDGLEETRKREQGMYSKMTQKEIEKAVKFKEKDEVLKDMVNGREKREEERYSEMVEGGLEETKNRQDNEKIEKLREDEEFEKIVEEGVEELIKRNEQKRKNLGSNDNPKIKTRANSIVIGRNGGKIWVTDNLSYSFTKKTIKESVNLEANEVYDIVKNVLGENKVGIEVKKLIERHMEENNLDPIVVNAINSTNGIDDSVKKKLMVNYLRDLEQIENGEPFPAKSSIVYDYEDLSKAGLLGRLFKKELNEEEKLKTIRRASGKAYKCGMVRTEGEYKPDWKSKLIGAITKRKVLTLKEAMPKEEFENMYMVANAYDWLRYDKEGQKRSHEEIREKYYSEKDKELDILKENQHFELRGLMRSQARQELKEKLDIDNSDNHIEREANKRMEKAEEELAKNVQRVTGKMEKIDENGNPIKESEENTL